MSLVPNVSYANTNTPVFLLANVSSLNVNSISTNSINANAISSITTNSVSSFATYISAADVELSSIYATVLDLDGQVLTANPTELLLNGIPLATTANISSLQDWALDPAISSINADGNDILNANHIYGSNVSTINVRAQTVFTNNLFANNIFAFSTYTSTISSLAEVADFGYIGHLSSGNAYIGNLSSLTGAFSSITADNALLSTMTISTLSAQSIQVSSFTSEVGQVSSLFISSINNNEINSSSITVNVVGVSSLVANSISSLGAEIRQALMSSIVFSPSLNPSLGGVNVNLGLGGILGNVIGWGAGVFGAAVGTVALATSMIALTSGRQTNYIDNSRYELVNGATQLQFSTLGSQFSTIYRFNNSADPQRIPGEEIFISTINPAGLAVRSLSDPINSVSTPTSTIQMFGEWVPVPIDLVSTFTDIYTSSITASTITTNEASVSSITNLSSINGVPVAEFGDPADWALFQAISTIEFSTSVAAVVRASPGSDIAVLGNGIKLIGGYTDAYNKLIVSTLSTAVIQGANDNLFGIGAQGLEIRTEPTGTVWISSPQTNIAGLTNCSTVGAFLHTGRFGNLSSITTSSINIVQQGAFGLSTLMYVSTSPITGTGTSTCMYLNTDISVGQNDMWCQQLRVGYSNTSSQPSEIIMYAPNASAISFNVANNDRTARIQSTINSVNAGYLFDTLLNPPIFSTINASTAVMAYFPSTTTSNIGISTLSFIPPIQYVGSWYSSTSQTVVGANTQTPLTYNSQSINVGGFTYSGSTITVPIAGVYEITHSIQFATSSGGTNLAQFYPLKNGATVPQTNSIVAIVNNGDTLGTISFIDSAAANDKYGIAIYSADTNMAATATAAGATPAVPSIITNIKRL